MKFVSLGMTLIAGLALSVSASAAVFDCHVKVQGATRDIGIITLDTDHPLQPMGKNRLAVDGDKFIAYCNVDAPDRARPEADIWCALGPGFPGQPGPSARAQTGASAKYLLLDRVLYDDGAGNHGWYEVKCLRRL